MYVGFYGMSVLGVLGVVGAVLLVMFFGPYAIFSLIAPGVAFAVSSGMYGKHAQSYHTMRIVRAERREDAKVQAEKQAEQERLDALCRPWNLILRDSATSKEEKDFAREILKGLVVGAK